MSDICTLGPIPHLQIFAVLVCFWLHIHSSPQEATKAHLAPIMTEFTYCCSWSLVAGINVLMWLLRTLSSDPNLADRPVHIDRDLVWEPRPAWDAASLLGLIPSLSVQFSLYFSLVRELICSHLHSDVNGVTRHKQGSDPHMLLRKHAGTLHTLWPNTTNTHTALAWQMAPAGMPKHSPQSRLPLSGHQHMGSQVNERLDDWAIFLWCCVQGCFCQQRIDSWEKTEWHKQRQHPQLGGHSQ